jgi:hypothetical protein
MLSGSTGAMTGRLSVGCKSPLTGTIKESNAGGQAAQVLARLGYAAIVIEGKPEGDDLYKIFINKDGVKISVDNSLKLMDNYPVVEKLRKEYGDKAAFMSIGSAWVMREIHYDPAKDDKFRKLSEYLARMAKQMPKKPINPADPSSMQVPDNPLLIRADQATPAKYIQKVMELCGKAGIQIWKVELAAGTETPEDGKTNGAN